MTFPATIDTRTVRVGAAHTSQWQGVDATVTLTPEFTTAVDTATGDLVVATPIRLDLTEGNAWTASVDVLASDTRGLSVAGFTWRVSYYLTGRKAQPAPWRVLIPRWEAPGAAPVLDLEVTAHTTAPGAASGQVPVVTQDQYAALAARVTALEAALANGGTPAPVDTTAYLTPYLESYL